MYTPRTIYIVEMGIGPNYIYHRTYPFLSLSEAQSKYNHICDYINSKDADYSYAEIYKKVFNSDGTLTIIGLACTTRVYPPKREMNHLLKTVKESEVAF